MFTSSMKCLRLAILVVLFTFPLLSYELSVKDGSEGTCDGRAVRAKAPKKFEFRKLVKVAPSIEDDEDDDDNDDEDYKFKFEAVRKVDGSKAKTVEKPTEDVEEDEERKEDKKEHPRFLSLLSFITDLFDDPPETVEPKNEIIDWIKWIGGYFKDSLEDSKSNGIDWMSYLNRWPFNSFFPIGKPEKIISLPGVPDLLNKFINGGEPMSQVHFESLLHTLPGFVLNGSDVEDIECKQQMQIFHRQLRGHKFWTLQMLDSTGKVTSGMLRGNINQLGDFEMCTHAKTVVKVTSDISKRIRGKYCLAHIETQAKIDELKVPVHLAQGRGLWRSHLGNPSHFVPRYPVASWGVCIPNACSASVVQDMLETNLRPYNNTGVEFHVEVAESDCYVRTSRKLTKLFKKDKKFSFAVYYLAFFWFISAAAYVSENWGIFSTYLNGFFKSSSDKTPEDAGNEEAPAEEPEDESTPTNEVIIKEIFHSFSPKRSLSQLISQERLDMQFPVFHLLKILATFFLYVCLKYMMVGHLPITNRDKLVKTVDQPLSIVFRSPMLYTDLLLIISGFLSAYQLSEEMEQKTFIGVIRRILAKVLRYLPTIYAVLFFQTWILPHLGAGPLWNKLIGQNADLCEQNMWRVLFGVQNAIDFEETCSPITIQLALELQLYLLGPLIVWLYYTDADAGFFAYGAFQAMSVAVRFARTNLEQLSAIMFHGMNVSKFYRTANILFSSPISRATPYLMGIGAGIIYRSTDGNLEIPAGMVQVGWVATLCSIVWCFWYPSSGMRSDYIYNSWEAASYASWCPLILGLAIIWIVFMTPKDVPILSALLTSKPVLFLSRISFPMQLVSYTVVMYTTAGVKDSSKYHLSDLINIVELATIVLCSTFLAFLIDVPFQNVRVIIIKKLFTEKPSQEVQDDGELDQLEDISEVALEGSLENQVSKPNTPEPPVADLWDADPEEKEHDEPELDSSSELDLETTIENSNDKIEIDDETEVEEEEEDEIAEEDEVIRRPITPETPSTPPPTASVETPIGYRRRRPTIEDEE